jgi:hypothetical protein
VDRSAGRLDRLLQRLAEDLRDRGGLPIAVRVASASPYQPHLVPAILDARFLPDLPWCLIGDRGYDSDGLDDLMTSL